MLESYLQILQDSWILKSLSWNKVKNVGLWKFYILDFQQFRFTYGFGPGGFEQIRIIILHPDASELQIFNVVYQDSESVIQNPYQNGNWNLALKETFNKIKEANKIVVQNRKAHQEKLEKFNTLFEGV